MIKEIIETGKMAVIKESGSERKLILKIKDTQGIWDPSQSMEISCLLLSRLKQPLRLRNYSYS